MLGPNTISNSEILKQCDLAQNNGWSENSTVAWAIIAFSRNMDLKKVEKEVEINSFLVHLKFAFTHNEKTLSFKKSKWFWIVMDQMTPKKNRKLQTMNSGLPTKIEIQTYQKNPNLDLFGQKSAKPRKKPKKIKLRIHKKPEHRTRLLSLAQH